MGKFPIFAVVGFLLMNFCLFCDSIKKVDRFGRVLVWNGFEWEIFRFVEGKPLIFGDKTENLWIFK